MQKQMTKAQQMEKMWEQREAQLAKQKELDWAKAEKLMKR
jgi:hypothetical protein